MIALPNVIAYVRRYPHQILHALTASATFPVRTDLRKTSTLSLSPFPLDHVLRYPLAIVAFIYSNVVHHQAHTTGAGLTRWGSFAIRWTEVPSPGDSLAGCLRYPSVVPGLSAH